jgi:integrative and conjugative element protein (TIGR02256 family)
MVRLCQSADHVETGGILVGRYSSDHSMAIITIVSDAPSDSKHSRTRFLRGARGLQGWLNRLWNQNSGYYLGEWHYHPLAAPNPSSCDLDAMGRISSSRSYNCPEPLLVILGGDPYTRLDIRGFVFAGGGLIELL